MLHDKRALLRIERPVVIEIRLVEQLPKQFRDLALLQKLILVRIEVLPMRQQHPKLHDRQLRAGPRIAKTRRLRERPLKTSARARLRVLRPRGSAANDGANEHRKDRGKWRAFHQIIVGVEALRVAQRTKRFNEAISCRRPPKQQDKLPRTAGVGERLFSEAERRGCGPAENFE